MGGLPGGEAYPGDARRSWQLLSESADARVLVVETSTGSWISCSVLGPSHLPLLSYIRGSR